MKLLGVYPFPPSSLELPLEFFQYFLLPFFHNNGRKQTLSIESHWSTMLACFALLWTFSSYMVIFRWLNLQNSELSLFPTGPSRAISPLQQLQVNADPNMFAVPQGWLLGTDLNAINKQMVLQDNALRNSAELTWCYCILLKQTFSLCLITESLHGNARHGTRPSYIQGSMKPVTWSGLPLTQQHTWMHLSAS